jgi:hypothetical protein
VIFPVTNSSACSGAMVMNALGSGSHIRLQSSIRGYVHHVTVPDHKSLRLGTLNKILSDVADYLNIERSQLAQELFDK